MGDIKDVSDSYARNFLLPKRVAMPATPESIKQAETLKQKREQANTENKEVALETAKKLEGMVIEIEEDANEEGHLYGSINTKIIAKELKKKKVNIDEDRINLTENIKTIGKREIELELHPEVKVKIRVVISAKK